jgi:rubrerythrin
MPIQSVSELYAHAIAIEREAAERYADLAERMHDEGREDLARVFDLLERQESEHLEALEARSDGVALPPVPWGQYQWIEAGAPHTVARAMVFRLMTPRMALAIALQAEKRAQAFFERVFMTCNDPALRALAREMAAEEQQHAQLIERLLESTPEPKLATTLIFEN